MDRGNGKCLLLPPTESIRAKLGMPPQMDVGPYAYGWSDVIKKTLRRNNLKIEEAQDRRTLRGQRPTKKKIKYYILNDLTANSSLLWACPSLHKQALSLSNSRHLIRYGLTCFPTHRPVLRDSQHSFDVLIRGDRIRDVPDNLIYRHQQRIAV